jgi:hypothetical protein
VSVSNDLLGRMLEEMGIVHRGRRPVHRARTLQSRRQPRLQTTLELLERHTPLPEAHGGRRGSAFQAHGTHSHGRWRAPRVHAGTKDASAGVVHPSKAATHVNVLDSTDRDIWIPP